jgi:dihydroxy-acid dehydratase
MPEQREMLAAPVATPDAGRSAAEHRRAVPRRDAVRWPDGTSPIGTTAQGIGRRAPESADACSTGLERDGDLIRVDIAARKVDALIDRSELEARRDSRAPILPRSTRGVPNFSAPIRLVRTAAV